MIEMRWKNDCSLFMLYLCRRGIDKVPQPDLQKVKESEVTQLCPTLRDPMDCIQPTRLLPSVGFSRQEYCSGLPFPSPGDLPDPGVEPGSPALQADILPTNCSYWIQLSHRQVHQILIIPTKWLFSTFVKIDGKTLWISFAEIHKANNFM